MIELELTALIREALDRAAPTLGLGEDRPPVEVIRPRQKEHGDYATGVALALASATGRKPREVAELLISHLPQSEVVAKAEVAGPGFINFFLTHTWLYGVLGQVLEQGGDYGRVGAGQGEQVLVEFVSANPTGPLHVGTGRNAALGDALARLLDVAGYRVSREYYVNDAGNQIALFGASIEARYLEHFGREGAVPEGGYQGGYVRDLAAAVAADLGEGLLERSPEDRRERLAQEGLRRTLQGIGATLEGFGVVFDRWFHETELHQSGRIEQAVELLKDRDLAYESDGATWFRAERFGDTKDRVLIKASGEPTYFAADCAYLRDKFARGFDHLIYVWGADHHGTVKRLEGVATAYGYDVDRVEIMLTQLVALYRGGEPVRMSKRTGEIITLDELVEEVGPDAARYTLLSRSPDTALDFDIEAVKRRSLDNPVFYVQYAHARIASVIRFAAEQGVPMEPFATIRPEELVHETELDLLRTMGELPSLIRLIADARAPHRLTRYAEDLAHGFHRFYTECRVVTDQPALTQARLHLAAGTKRVIANVLGILGVSAPESMDRLGEEEA